MEIGRRFGERTVDKYARAAAADVKQQLEAGRYLRASFSAAHYVVLSGKTAWTSEEQERMSAALREETELRLAANDEATAAWRAAYDRMLTSEQAWSEAVLFRLRNAVAPGKVQADAGRRLFVAAEAADYLLLGGFPFWDQSELDHMLAAITEDFNVCARRGDDIMAADRLVVYKLLAEGAHPG